MRQASRGLHASVKGRAKSSRRRMGSWSRVSVVVTKGSVGSMPSRPKPFLPRTPGPPWTGSDLSAVTSRRAAQCGARRDLRRPLAVEKADSSHQEIEQEERDRGAHEARPEVLVVADDLARGIEDLGSRRIEDVAPGAA